MEGLFGVIINCAIQKVYGIVAHKLHNQECNIKKENVL